MISFIKSVITLTGEK